MQPDTVCALILAAGKGTRMHSDTPKVLQPVLGEPMLAFVSGALHPSFGERVWVVIGHGAALVRAAFGETLNYVEQAEQLGTGHALGCALPALCAAGMKRVLVVNGDMPLLSPEVVESILEGAGDADVAVTSLMLDEPGSYGRIVRRDGAFAGIIEAKDYDAAVWGRPTGEINAGVYVLNLDAVKKLLPRLTKNNAGGEYYITDLAGLALENGFSVRAVPCGGETALLGVNSPLELAAAEETLRGRIVASHLAAGVMIHFPEHVAVGPFVQLEPGAAITGPCQLYGRTSVARGAQIGPFCVVSESVIMEGAEVRAFSHLDHAVVGKEALVGPYTRLRPGAVLDEKAHAGNFVEMKKARLGCGAKANHLTYLGDADVGAGSNIGAGTITCNYDGVNKHRTSIGERAFIGSNTALVAPVSVGAGALVGAGSVITGDVPEGTLAVARARQKVLPRRFK